MARYADTRSPSPVGSTYSSSKRSRKDEDRYDRSRKDDDRHHRRRRSRSRSPEVRVDSSNNRRIGTDADWSQRRRRDYDRDRERDRDRDRDRDHYRRRDRSLDRRHDDRYDRDRDRYSSRRERSRDRRRSRDRDSRRLSRDSDLRLKREDSRDRDRKRRDDSADSRKRKREDSRERPSSKRGKDLDPKEVRSLAQSHSNSTHTCLQSSKPATASADDEKAARLKKLEEWKRKQAAAQQSQTSSPKPAASPKTPTTAIAAPPPPKSASKPATISIKKPLGADAAIPTAKQISTLPKANVPSPKSTAPAVSLKSKGNLSGFSIGGKAQGDAEVGKKALDFKEEDVVRIKLAKLPSLPNADINGQDEVMQDQDDGDDANIEDDQDEEEALAAARAAAEQRSRAEQTDDMAMTEAPAALQDNGAEEEEDDPLDAFMQDLSAVPAKKTMFKGKANTNGKAISQEPESFFNDDEVELTAIDQDDPGNIMAKAEEIAKKKKKDIGTVNHAKVQYEPFRRNFYTEPTDMQDWTEDDVANLRMELDNIKVRGVEVPKPVQTWAQCGLGVQVLDVIQTLGYPAPTSIQSQAIPSIMSGRDVIGVAKTGSGKTIAFLLPMFRHIKDQRPLDSLDGPIGLVLSPTRELATQIHKECKPFLKALGLRAVCAYGGAPIKDQIADLKRGAEIVVCTPGRMIDLLAANSGRVTNLKRITYLVLDEADRMFDMGFEPQVMKILANIRPDRQTVLFSATFPRSMEALARKTLVKPVEIIVGGRSVVAPEITQVVEVLPDTGKFNRLLGLLGKLYEDEANEDDRTLIFVDRQESADGLLRDLMKKGYPCMSIHGGKDQIDRDSTIDDFKAGVVPIMIATSVAARGLDVKQLKLVVNYDAPNHLEDYVHRAGRTGRAGNKGTAVTFLTEEQDRYAVDIAKALKQSGQTIPEPVQKLVDEFAEKVKAGKEKGYAGGFGGKGLERFDAQRDAEKARERKTYKTGDDNEEEEEKEELKEAKVGDDIFAKAASGVAARDEPQSPAPALPGVPKGIDLDGKIVVHKTERPAAGAAGNKSQMDKVAAAVAGINAKLSKAGVMRSGVPIDNKGPDAGAFHATLEINDFPQRARWSVTNRTNVAKILESTGTSITTKGTFYKTGDVPGPNDLPKLYILVEGDSELVVQQAMRELMGLLKEGTLAAAAGEPRTSGRYSVV
ncbi:pre-mRNA processing RNA-helicase [Knufia fluminis]|uniref:Pre-mRNA-processing ATP-dependent RNA helicase PRP5 n=1 Tax=Knufia fluminis TaxID=191047 RepID=A0AAN8EQS5_9EURO|nr:pre-mRNA processing RNA-helicase [Knufia fluminis]